MDAVIHIKPDEFNEKLFERIKSLINLVNDAEITISINKSLPFKNVLENVELNRNLTYFTLDEYEEFKRQLLNEP